MKSISNFQKSLNICFFKSQKRVWEAQGACGSSSSEKRLFSEDHVSSKKSLSSVVNYIPGIPDKERA